MLWNVFHLNLATPEILRTVDGRALNRDETLLDRSAFHGQLLVAVLENRNRGFGAIEMFVSCSKALASNVWAAESVSRLNR